MRALTFALLLSSPACIDAKRAVPSSDTADAPPADAADSAVQEDETVTTACVAPSRCSETRDGIETCAQGTWSTASSCGVTQLCVDVNGPYCISALGNRSCYDQLRCAAACRPDDPIGREECITLCYADAELIAKAPLAAASECFAHQCGTVCEDQALEPTGLDCYTAIFDCVATKCADELATCDFGTANVGTKPCDEIRSCGRDCNDGSPDDQSDCTIACVQEGDLDARKLYAVKDLCEYFVCIEAADGCDALATQYCATYINACHADD